VKNMTRVAIEVDAAQIESALEKLDDNERWKIVRDIIRREFKSVADKFRKTIRKKNLSFEKIDRVVEEAREEFYAKSRDRR
jgi:hypothetical protein